MDYTFNPAQLATYEQAIQIAHDISPAVGGGVKPFPKTLDMFLTMRQDDNSPAEGIYIPNWAAGPTGFPIPHGKLADGTPTFWLHFRFYNGASGMNVGLIADKFRRFPRSPGYVLQNLAAEADEIAQG